MVAPKKLSPYRKKTKQKQYTKKKTFVQASTLQNISTHTGKKYTQGKSPERNTVRETSETKQNEFRSNLSWDARGRKTKRTKKQINKKKKKKHRMKTARPRLHACLRGFREKQRRGPINHANATRCTCSREANRLGYFSGMREHGRPVFRLQILPPSQANEIRGSGFVHGLRKVGD